MFDHTEQDRLNQEAFDNPQPGDYWHEMFCPYFVIVDRKADKFTVLSCLGGPSSWNRKDELNARRDLGVGTWCFDYAKSMQVDMAWIENAVKYKNQSGFVADVIRSEKTQAVVTAWRDWVQQDMRRRIDALESEWREFTGWKALEETT